MNTFINQTITIKSDDTSSGFDFYVGVNSIRGTCIIDMDITGVNSAGHAGIAFNRQGNQSGLPVEGTHHTNQLWRQAQGPIFFSNGDVKLESWFQNIHEGSVSATVVKVGNVGTNKRLRVTHTTYDSGNRAVRIESIPSLGAPSGFLLFNFEYDATPQGTALAGLYFSPFVYGAGSEIIVRAMRLD